MRNLRHLLLSCFAPSIAKDSPSFYTIPDRYNTIEEVQDALRKVGFESSNLILGIDFTKSNTWSGSKTFGGCCLHEVSSNSTRLNPYQQVIQVIGRTLEVFDDDRLIPAFGFGDSHTQDKKCFPFYPNLRPAHGFEEVLQRYNEIAPGIVLAGPTSFAPVIQAAIDIVQEEGSYHILVIIADGQVSNRRETEAAIVEASRYPLSIVVVGVGDGPWDVMTEFDDELPERAFDNFQFVPFDETVRDARKKGLNIDAAFAKAALMEIPEQYHLIKKLRYL